MVATVPCNFEVLTFVAQQPAIATRKQLAQDEDYQKAHDLYKIQAAVHLLTTCKLDSDFPLLVDLLAKCKAPRLMQPFGVTTPTELRLMHCIVAREVTHTAIGITQSPLCASIIDGSLKKSMRGAPDMIKARYVCMNTGSVFTQHGSLISPTKDDFLHSVPCVVEPRYVENQQSAKRPISRLKEQS